MTGSPASKPTKERSKSFPVLPLKSAVERLQQFELKFGRHPAPYEKAGLAWGMEEGSSQANRFLAALKAFGLVDYHGAGKDRSVSISNAGRTYLRAQQDSIKKDVLRSVALLPKQIAQFWPQWGVDRPPNEVCLDDLILKHGFTDASAPQFLKVYDETIAFAGLNASDKIDPSRQDAEDDDGEDELVHTHVSGGEPTTLAAKAPQLAAAPARLGPGERIIKTGLLARDASFKLIVAGRIGPKEIDRLIQQLEIDKEILADPEAEPQGE